jgi:RHS repeat-associated protein
LHVTTGTFIQLSNPDLKVDYYTAEIVKSTEYSCYGVELSGWGCVSVDSYRYGFQDQETDKELWSGVVSYLYRIEDPRLGRFFSADPLAPEYAYNSPYAFSENMVINMVELEGLEAAPPAGAPSDQQIMYQNPNVVTTQAGVNLNGPPQDPGAFLQAPLDLSTLTGTQQQMGTRILQHYLAFQEAMLADPMSPWNQGLGIPTNMLFVNIGISAFNLNTPVNVTMMDPGAKPGAGGLPVVFSLNCNGVPGEAFGGLVQTNSGPGGANPDGTVVAVGSQDLSISRNTLVAGFISIRASDVVLNRPNAQGLESRFWSLFNHSLILRDRIIIRNENQAPRSALGDIYPSVPANARVLLAWYGIGFRAVNIGVGFLFPNLIKSDGDFIQ